MEKLYGNAVVGQSGGPTAVINASAAGVFTEALNTDRRVIVFCHAPLHNAGIFGTEGMPQGMKPYDDMINGWIENAEIVWESEFESLDLNALLGIA